MAKTWKGSDMINQNHPKLQEFLDYMSTNPSKIMNRLENPFGRCCLGHMCHIMIPETRMNASGSVYYGRIGFDQESGELPKELAAELNIKQQGIFTRTGLHFVRIFLRENNVKLTNAAMVDLTALTNINDRTNATHDIIGALIAELMRIERELNIECFEPTQA